MKNTLFFNAAALILCLLLADGCKKKLPNKPVDAGLKAAFSFKPGSYWIYKDSISGQIDSFYVKGISSANYTSGYPSYTYDQISVEIKEVNEMPAGSDTAERGIGMLQNSLYLNDWYLDNYFNYDPVLFPFVSGIQSSTVYSESINLVNSLAIGVNNFNNVAIVNFSGGLNDYFYLNSDIGLIQIVLNQRGATRVWEIQRWNITK